MLTSRRLLPAFASLSILLGVVASPAVGVQTPEIVSDQSAQFGEVEQPLLRIGLTLGGFALIGILISSVIESSQVESGVGNPGASIQNL